MDGVEFAQRGIGLGTVEKFRRQMFEIDTGDTRGQGFLCPAHKCSIFDACPTSARFSEAASGGGDHCLTSGQAGLGGPNACSPGICVRIW